MNDEGMQIGELRHTPRERRVRPDRNQQYAVLVCGAPDEHDLPVFVELDALRELEAHAASDVRVELGGVLLGGQYEDDDGQPFVLVSDSLRAEHHESTRASFKFTHETWSQITRQRAGFAPDLQMVGWYHTHPGFGLFLSDMDAFICHNFFNKELDLALVLDPCRPDRAWFQWSGGAERQLRRMGGFCVFASRHRRDELEALAAQEKGAPDMGNEIRFGGPSGHNPPAVIQVTPPSAPWLALAAIGMLTGQLLVVALIAWRLLLPAPAKETAAAGRGGDPIHKTAAGRGGDPAYVAAKDSYQEHVELEQQAREVESMRRLLDRIAGELGSGSTEGLVRMLEQAQRDNDRLRQDSQVYRAQEAKLRHDHGQLTTTLEETRAEADRFQEEATKNKLRVAELLDEEKSLRRKLAAVEQEAPQDDAEEPPDAVAGLRDRPAPWMWSTGVLAVLLVVAIGAAVTAARRPRESAPKSNEPAPSAD